MRSQSIMRHKANIAVAVFGALGLSIAVNFAIATHQERNELALKPNAKVLPTSHYFKEDIERD